MENPFRWKALFKALILPPGAALLIALVGLALLNRYPRLGRVLATLGVALLVLVSLPAVAAFLIRFVDDSPPFDPSRARSAQAIVILGGGTRRAAPEYDGDTLNRLTLERVRYGARVQVIRDRNEALPRQVEAEYLAHDLRFGRIDHQPPAFGSDVIAQRRRSPNPFPLAPRRRHLVSCPLAHQAPFEFRER